MQSNDQRPSDYIEILDILEHAYGDPNKPKSARDKLLKYRQTNKLFSVFIAEFQRLALGGKVSEDSKIMLLEASINDEAEHILSAREREQSSTGAAGSGQVRGGGGDESTGARG